ncbi:MAG TPA: rhamnulokinase family protein [Candidatus Limnocylindria bacterium]|jgi:rhamnulokinase|nr:rhamnulokinase family protein [Candidatus Limnocylindria bacterium]
MSDLPAQQVYLGVDLGAESGRVMAGSWNGSRFELSQLHRFSNGSIRIANTLRWDILRLWSEIQNGLTAGGKEFGSEVRAVGVDTWALDFVLLSKSGEMLGLPHHYRDARTKGLIKVADNKVPRAEIFAASGIQFMEINTLYQWMAMHRTSPEVIAAADRFLMIPDFLNWCLCGSTSVEFTNATTTQFYHPTRKTWSTELLGRLGLSSAPLREVVLPGTVLDSLRESVQAITGLGANVQTIAPATHDTASAVAAVPTERTGKAGWAYISSGTWSLVGIESAEPYLSERALELNLTNEGGVDGTWRVLKNVMGLWLVQQCRRAFEAQGGTADYGVLVSLAEQANPLRAIIDPDDARFLNPTDMPAAIRGYCGETGQRVPIGEAAIIRCVLESLALKYAVVVGQIEEVTQQRIEVIHIVGGGSRNRLLNQLTADACQCPVVAGPAEATILGNLLVQARTLGELGSLADIRQAVRRSADVECFEPRPDTQGMWGAARERLAGLLPQRF